MLRGLATNLDKCERKGGYFASAWTLAVSLDACTEAFRKLAHAHYFSVKVEQDYRWVNLHDPPSAAIFWMGAGVLSEENTWCE